MRHHRSRIAIFSFFFLMTSGVFAEVAPGTPTTPHENVWSKFKFFGYLNIAYGKTDGHTYRGSTEDGTVDFRTAAVQARFEATANTEVVLQLANESVGKSPSDELRDDVELDWLFVRHRFKNGTSVRLGRVPLPIGIYNEIKDVGAALPFYRPSDNFYGEGTWTSDSVDGIVVSHNFATGAGWDFNVDLYYGDWKRIESDGGALRYAEADISDALGFFTWVTTPVEGLRVGFGWNEFEASGGTFLAPGVTDQESTRYLSIDGAFDKLTLRFETSKRNFTGGYWQPYYFEAGYQVADRWKVNALYDVGKLKYEIPFFATFDDKIEEVKGISVNYEIRPGWVAKVEHRWARTYSQIEDLPLNIFFDDPVDVRLGLASVAFSF